MCKNVGKTHARTNSNGTSFFIIRSLLINYPFNILIVHGKYDDGLVKRCAILRSLLRTYYQKDFPILLVKYRYL